jgi:hypothetical protein
LIRASRSSYLYICFQAVLLATTLLAPHSYLQGQELKVHYRAGAEHGFLLLHDLTGAILAHGEITQVPYRDRIKLHLVFRFRDGSLDDETTVYSQQHTFHLISDRLIQTGKSFPNPCDMTIDMGAQQVSVRAVSKGKPVVTSEHMDLPPDLANGIIFTLIQNLQAKDPKVEVPYLAPGAKPRMVKFAIAQEGEEQFKIGGHPYKAMKYDLKGNIGGIAGVVAPMIGKQPPDTHVWITESSVPAIIRVEGALYNEGPVWNIQVASPAW